jgi:hypothetical protein
MKNHEQTHIARVLVDETHFDGGAADTQSYSVDLAGNESSLCPITWIGFECDPDRLFFRTTDGRRHAVTVHAALDGSLFDLPATDPDKRDRAKQVAELCVAGTPPM